MRICPKITTNHLILTNAAKMRVRLATQVKHLNSILFNVLTDYLIEQSNSLKNISLYKRHCYRFLVNRCLMD